MVRLGVGATVGEGLASALQAASRRDQMAIDGADGLHGPLSRIDEAMIGPSCPPMRRSPSPSTSRSRGPGWMPGVYDYYAGGARRERFAGRQPRRVGPLGCDPALVDVGRATCRRPPSHAAGPSIIVRRWRPTASPTHAERATAAAPLPRALLTLSTIARRRWRRGRGRPGGTGWLQLNAPPTGIDCRELVDRAVAAGYGAVVVTVDLPMPGNRERDQRNGFVLPLGAHLPPEQPTDETGLVVLPTLDWRELDWLRSVCPVPLLAKGILRADDAARAVDAGCDGIWVSNHGGRQLDTAIAAIDALPQMRRPSGRACWWSTALRRGIDSSRAGARL